MKRFPRNREQGIELISLMKFPVLEKVWNNFNVQEIFFGFSSREDVMILMIFE